MDVVANIALIVEREKRVLSGYCSCVNIAEIFSLSSFNFSSVDDTAPVYLLSLPSSFIENCNKWRKVHEE